MYPIVFETELPGFTLLSFNPYPGNGGGGGGVKMTPLSGFCRKSHSKQWNKTAVFVTLLQTPWAFRRN